MIAGITLEALLKDHGFGGGGLVGSFGTGADGSFNPAQSTVSGTATLIMQGSSFYSTGSAPSSMPNSSTATSLPSIGFETTNGQTLAEVVSNTTGATWAAAANYTVTEDFKIDQNAYINAIEVYTVTGGVSATLYLWQQSNGSLIASGSVTTVANGWTKFTFTSPVQLTANTEYRIGSYSASAITYGCASGTNQTASYTTLQPTTYTFTSTVDGPPVIKNFTSINIPFGVTATVSNRCKGLIMLCQGNVTINGAISMDGMGAIADPTTGNQALAAIDSASYLYYPIADGSNKNKVIVIGPGGTGGAGGAGGTSGVASSSTITRGGNPTGGTWWGGGRGGGGAGGSGDLQMSNGWRPGGQGGDALYTGSPAGGSAVTAASSGGVSGNSGTGGSGGSGGATYGGYSATSGAGGAANGAGGGGGGGGAMAESGAITAQSGSASSGGAGGLILIIAHGTVTINTGATLSAKGSAGANGGNAATTVSGTYNGGAGGGGGGGGAGGGIIAILALGTITNSGTTSVSGGAGGTGGTSSNVTGSSNSAATNASPGASGQTGVVQIVRL